MKTGPLAILLMLAMAAAAAAESLDDLVAAKYPSGLTDIAAQHHYTDSRQQAYVSISDASSQYVVAAYSNGHVAAVALLERTTAALTPLQVIRDHVTGSEPSITAVDLDGDGGPEFVVSFQYPARIARHSRLRDWRDGSRRSGEHRHTRRTSRAVFSLCPAKWRICDKRGPRAETRTFTVPSAEIGSRFRLTAINGAASGKPYRVGSGTVTLNGVVISPPSDFSESRAAWTIPVTLQENNTIMVQLDGKPAGRVAIAIRHD